jgi:2'-5' RNA ligase
VVPSSGGAGVRAFVAVEVGEMTHLDGLASPTPEAPRHFTLRFLGELDGGIVREVDRTLGPVVAGFPSFPLTLAGIGAFPDWHRPRVIYAAATSGRGELEALAEAVNEALDALGLRREPRPFVPHVTLRRVRSPRDVEAGRRLAEEAGDRVLSEVEVREVLLKESELFDTGAVHRVIGRYPLLPASE